MKSILFALVLSFTLAGFTSEASAMGRSRSTTTTVDSIENFSIANYGYNGSPEAKENCVSENAKIAARLATLNRTATITASASFERTVTHVQNGSPDVTFWCGLNAKSSNPETKFSVSDFRGVNSAEVANTEQLFSGPNVIVLKTICSSLTDSCRVVAIEIK